MSVVTPSRTVSLHLDTAENVVVRPVQTFTRPAAMISKGKAEGAGVTEGVSLQPGGAWILSPLKGDLSRVAHEDYSAGPIPAADLNLATGWASVSLFKKQADVTGLGYDSDIITSGVTGYRRRMEAGTDRSSATYRLDADQTAFPQPTLDSADVPMDRVLQGKKSYPALTGYSLVFQTLGDTVPPDSLATFYFGGPSDPEPATEGVGQFALNLRGDGTATLFEKVASGWSKRYQFLFLQPGHIGNRQTGVIRIIPYGRDTIAFHASGMDAHNGGMIPFSYQYPLVGVGKIDATTRTFYRNQKSLTGYRAKSGITGPGIVRLDVRRDLRSQFVLVRHLYPGGGTLVDLPFHIAYPVPDGTKMTLSAPGALIINDTELTGTLHRADTNDPITTDADGYWLTEDGVQEYYVVWDFASDVNHEYTPVLFGYEVEVEAAEEVHAGAYLTGGNLRSVSLSGPDLSPDTDTASIALTDPFNTLGPLLEKRGRIPYQLRTTAGSPGPGATSGTSILSEGKLLKAVGRRRGTTGRLYPSPSWREWDLTGVSPWARVVAHVNTDVKDFTVDLSAPEDPLTSEKPPWKITAIIYYLLRKVGFSASQINVPDLDLRLWASEQGGQSYFLQPGQPVAELIDRLARQYLGMILVWDPNAGALGQWRLLFNPTPPYTSLCTFRDYTALSAPRVATHPGAYPDGTFILKDTWRSYCIPPEANYVRVVGVGEALSADGGQQQLPVEMFNPLSYNFDPDNPTADPDHPDYLGECLPLLHVDPSISSYNEAAFVARRLFDFACHARKMASFRAPLYLVPLAADAALTRPRPLRIGDAVTISIAGGSETALIRNCAVNFTHTAVQMADYEIQFVVN